MKIIILLILTTMTCSAIADFPMPIKDINKVYFTAYEDLDYLDDVDYLRDGVEHRMVASDFVLKYFVYGLDGEAQSQPETLDQLNVYMQKKVQEFLANYPIHLGCA